MRGSAQNLLFNYQNHDEMKKIILLKVIFFIALGSANCQDRTIDSLEKLLLTQKDDTNKVNTLHELGYNYDRRGNTTKSFECCSASAELSHRIGFTKGEITNNTLKSSYFPFYLLLTCRKRNRKRK